MDNKSVSPIDVDLEIFRDASPLAKAMFYQLSQLDIKLAKLSELIEAAIHYEEVTGEGDE